MNLKLNPGGVILAIVGLICGVLLMTLIMPDDRAAGSGTRQTRGGTMLFGLIPAFIGGAIGNHLWTKIFPPKPPQK